MAYKRLREYDCPNPLYKADVIALFGSRAKLARFLGLTWGAVNDWPEVIPKINQYALREIRPKIDAEIRDMKARRGGIPKESKLCSRP